MANECDDFESRQLQRLRALRVLGADEVLLFGSLVALTDLLCDMRTRHRPSSALAKTDTFHMKITLRDSAARASGPAEVSATGHDENPLRLTHNVGKKATRADLALSEAAVQSVDQSNAWSHSARG